MKKRKLIVEHGATRPARPPLVLAATTSRSSTAVGQQAAAKTLDMVLTAGVRLLELVERNTDLTTFVNGVHGRNGK
jgi:hypothetical protein